ncbi:MAG TPA: shikimate dehydrogenase [Burkholderiales bacterium]|nr:shikimate dehydrogenase [Burkholderiales bacterium]
MTDLYAVVGNPIAHSKSPRIHAEFARQTGEDLAYEAILAPLDGFARTVGAFRARRGRGINVTVPFKIEAYQYAVEHTPRAARAGAVNTLRFEQGRVLGENTDGVGLTRDIEANLGIPLTGVRVLLLGAGGAARGVVLPILERGPAALVIANRSPARAAELRALFPEFASVEGGGYDALAGRHFEVVINATSASLADALPPLPPEAFVPGALAYDMMYGRASTPFLAFARSHGAGRCADGLGMLVEQAAESFFLWRGVRPETAPVIAKLRQEL